MPFTLEAYSVHLPVQEQTLSERNLYMDVRHGGVHVSALSHACIRATLPGGVYRGASPRTDQWRKRRNESRSEIPRERRTIPPPTLDLELQAQPARTNTSQDTSLHNSNLPGSPQF